jgi:hypothetical protein
MLRCAPHARASNTLAAKVKHPGSARQLLLLKAPKKRLTRFTHALGSQSVRVFSLTRDTNTERGFCMKTVAATSQLEALTQRHRLLEAELNTLARRAHPTPAEEQRTRILKKEKLRAKDTMRILMDQVRMR